MLGKPYLPMFIVSGILVFVNGNLIYDESASAGGCTGQRTINQITERFWSSRPNGVTTAASVRNALAGRPAAFAYSGILYLRTVYHKRGKSSSPYGFNSRKIQGLLRIAIVRCGKKMSFRASAHTGVGIRSPHQCRLTNILRGCGLPHQ